MKKISTVAVKQIRNFSEQKLTIGLDLGDRSSWYCVLDEAGEGRLEQKLGTTPKAMNQVFGSSLALYFAKKGDVTQATEFLKRARGLDPSSVDLILIAAEVHALSNRTEEAILDLRKGLQQGLTTTSIESDPELESLRKRSDYQALLNQYASKRK